MNLYELKDVQYSYLWNQQKVPVLNKINRTFPVGCFTCIVGPSGSGKTTLLNLMGLIDRSSGGKVHFLNQDVSELPEDEAEGIRLHKVGFIFQSFYLIPTLTVLENTSYFLPQLNLNKKTAKERAEEILSLLGLQDHLNKLPSQLSGGQRQRVAIARAMAKRPAVILADEPTANLDSQTADTIITAFKKLQEQHQTSFIFSTHDPHLVSLAQETLQMKDGYLEPAKGLTSRY